MYLVSQKMFKKTQLNCVFYPFLNFDTPLKNFDTNTKVSCYNDITCSNKINPLKNVLTKTQDAFN